MNSNAKRYRPVAPMLANISTIRGPREQVTIEALVTLVWATRFLFQSTVLAFCAEAGR